MLFHFSRKWKRSVGVKLNDNHDHDYEEATRKSVGDLLSLSLLVSLFLLRYVATWRRFSPLDSPLDYGSIISAGADATPTAARDWTASAANGRRAVPLVLTLSRRAPSRRSGWAPERRGGVSRVRRQPSLDTSYSGCRISRSPTS